MAVYILFLFCRNGQRPGAVIGMTIDDFEEGIRFSGAGTGTILNILVRDHKVNTSAKVVVSGLLVEHLKKWVATARGLYVPAHCQFVFANEDGEKLSHLSRSLAKLAKCFDFVLPSATSVRKAIATKGGDLSDSSKAAVANAMSHSLSTANKYYRAYGEAKNIEGYEVIGSILEVPSMSAKKRRRFTDAQTDVIKEYFSDSIHLKVIPETPQLEKFLSENREEFQGRTRADIYSKIRNIIGRQST